jgi:hypothetical protein
MTDLDANLVAHDLSQARACLAADPDVELERLTDQDVLDMLGSIDNALRNGSNMNNANLAFELLCERLGVNRETLVFAPDRIGQIEDPAWRPRPPGWVERPAPVGSWWRTPDGVAYVNGDYLDGAGDQIVTYLLCRPDGASHSKWGGREFADAYTRLAGRPAQVAPEVVAEDAA